MNRLTDALRAIFFRKALAGDALAERVLCEERISHAPSFDVIVSLIAAQCAEDAKAVGGIAPPDGTRLDHVINLSA